VSRRVEIRVRCDAEGCEATAFTASDTWPSALSLLTGSGWRLGYRRDLCPTCAPRGGVTRAVAPALALLIFHPIPPHAVGLLIGALT
jgi:hypothetical protein